MTWFVWLILAQQPAVHAQCQQCHTEAAGDVESHPHFAKGVSCAACHGESETHIAASGHVAPDKVAVREQVPPLCGSCHPAQKKSFDLSRHAKVLYEGEKSAQCATCHGNHALKSVRAIENTCQRCHNPLPAACSKEKCSSCHSPHVFARYQVPRK